MGGREPALMEDILSWALAVKIARVCFSSSLVALFQSLRMTAVFKTLGFKACL
jgi:hypothetical protein